MPTTPDFFHAMHKSPQPCPRKLSHGAQTWGLEELAKGMCCKQAQPTFCGSLCVSGKQCPMRAPSGNKAPFQTLSSKPTFLWFALGCWAGTLQIAFLLGHWAPV